jgi:hypothetical protein
MLDAAAGREEMATVLKHTVTTARMEQVHRNGLISLAGQSVDWRSQRSTSVTGQGYRFEGVSGELTRVGAAITPGQIWQLTRLLFCTPASSGRAVVRE